MCEKIPDTEALIQCYKYTHYLSRLGTLNLMCIKSVYTVGFFSNEHTENGNKYKASCTFQGYELCKVLSLTYNYVKERI